MSRKKITATMPPGVASWFAGTASVEAAGWFALLPIEEPTLMAWWAAWKAQHPGARPPTDASWIVWPK